MSYCEIIIFKDGMPHESIEFNNAWGGAARIWSAMFDAYLKDPEKTWHTWLTDEGKALWPLASRDDIPMFERAVHASTFDKAYVLRANFPRLVADLRAFVAKYPVKGNQLDHLPAWADRIEKFEYEAIGFRGTSVAENPWWVWNQETEDYDATPMSEGFEVYECLDESIKKDKDAPCVWTNEEEDGWQTSCGDAHIFIDAGPKENNFKFCPYCGHTIAEPTPDPVMST